VNKDFQYFTVTDQFASKAVIKGRINAVLWGICLFLQSPNV